MEGCDSVLPSDAAPKERDRGRPEFSMGLGVVGKGLLDMRAMRSSPTQPEARSGFVDSDEAQVGLGRGSVHGYASSGIELNRPWRVSMMPRSIDMNDTSQRSSSSSRNPTRSPASAVDR